MRNTIVIAISFYTGYKMCSAEESTASTLRCTYDLASVSTTRTSKSVTTWGCQQPRTPRSAMRAGTLFLSSASLATGSRITSLYAIEARSYFIVPLDKYNDLYIDVYNKQ